jgi:lipoprotein-anchoring transpeptidase ErfK/SrfK
MAVARSAPSRSAAPVATLDARTPEGTTNLVLVVGRARDRDGVTWVRARLPVLGRAVGWLPRTALGAYGTVRTRLVVDRRRLRLTLLRDGRAILRAPVGVGAPGNPTPGGSFYVRDRVTAYASPAYGPIAFGTSARSRTLTDWPGGGFVGIHGTDQPGILPGRVSHGCIRMRNADILRLARLMPVGTPLKIV